MDPASVALVFALIEKTVELAPKVIDLIRRVRAGETVTKEEVEATEKLVKSAVDRWNASGPQPAKE